MTLTISHTFLIVTLLKMLVQTVNALTLTGAQLSFTEILSKYDYKCEEHSINTEDGYILTVFRLIQPTHCFNETKRRPVIIMHGYLLSADAWVLSGRNGFGFLIADLCLDLWIGNFRGNVYSRKHIKLNPDEDLDFWNYSHTELGRYDLPAILDYVLDVTGADDLNYIGFSQGAGSFYIMCSELPQYSAKVNLMISLAPATRHLYTESTMFRLVTQLADTYQENLKIAGVGEILGIGSSLQTFLNELCFTKIMCEVAKDIIDVKNYFHPEFVSNQTLAGIFKTFPAGTSVKNSAHFGQLMTSTDFNQFDHGTKNYEIYGTHRPPAFNLSVVTTPVVIIYGLNDGIVDSRDILWLVKKLPNILELYQVKEPLWTHFDFLYSIFTKNLVFSKVSEYLLKFS